MKNSKNASKIVKLNAAQLRDIITETVIAKSKKKSLNEDRALDLADDYADFVSEILTELIDRNADSIASAANTRLRRSLGDEALLPTQYKKTELFVYEVVEQVAFNKELIAYIVRTMLKEPID